MESVVLHSYNEIHLTGILHIKERRHCAQLLIILIRDFNKHLGNKKQIAPVLAQIYELCAKNLVYILSYYAQEVLLGESQQDIEF